MVLKNAAVFLENRFEICDVAVENGKITAIGPDLGCMAYMRIGFFRSNGTTLNIEHAALMICFLNFLSDCLALILLQEQAFAICTIRIQAMNARFGKIITEYRGTVQINFKMLGHGRNHSTNQTMQTIHKTCHPLLFMQFK